MKEKFSIGDIVKSMVGRDKDTIYLVVDVAEDRALLVDGRARKIKNPKRKNIKHIKKVLSEGEKTLAERIRAGIPTGNERVFKSIKTATEKI